jgi:hypothetical protein
MPLVPVTTPAGSHAGGQDESPRSPHESDDLTEIVDERDGRLVALQVAR